MLEKGWTNLKNEKHNINKRKRYNEEKVKKNRVG
jgi:hypothetical protein